MAEIEGATDPVDVFVAKRRGQVRLRGRSGRSLPDYIFKGRTKNRYYVVECKGSQSSRSAVIGQLQRGSEQVLTVDINPPALVTRLVIGSWLQRAIKILVIDPQDELETQKLSRWSGEEITHFGYAKRLTYVGDLSGASTVLRNLVRMENEQTVDGQELMTRKTDSGIFVGSEQIRMSPDGRQIRMFRGIEDNVRSAILREGKTSKLSEYSGSLLPDEPKAFSLETSRDDRISIVRSISRDGSLFEIQVS